jgi:hypothetical protein
MKETYLIAIDLYQAARRAGKPTDYCMCCGAVVAESVKGCWEAFTGLSERAYGEPIIMAAHFYAVDAHALQHPEIHGIKNNAAHLLRLHWLFAHHATARVAEIPRWWQHYLNVGPVPILDPPANRGALTVMDVVNAGPPEQIAARMQDWARAVYAAWHAHHAWAEGQLRQLLK